jgi:hypothetical protein
MFSFVLYIRSKLRNDISDRFVVVGCAIFVGVDSGGGWGGSMGMCVRLLMGEDGVEWLRGNSIS